MSRRDPTKTGPDGRPTAEYVAWESMKKRCHSPSAGNFKHYGARGVVVCQEWRESFAAFLGHIGQRPSPLHSVDRKDGAKGYEPGNVRWATKKEQQNNTRSNHRIEANGEALTITGWAERLGVQSSCITNRLTRGWSPFDAVTTPSGEQPTRRAA